MQRSKTICLTGNKDEKDKAVLQRIQILTKVIQAPITPADVIDTVTSAVGNDTFVVKAPGPAKNAGLTSRSTTKTNLIDLDYFATAKMLLGRGSAVVPAT